MNCRQASFKTYRAFRKGYLEQNPAKQYHTSIRIAGLFSTVRFRPPSSLLVFSETSLATKLALPTLQKNRQQGQDCLPDQVAWMTCANTTT